MVAADAVVTRGEVVVLREAGQPTCEQQSTADCLSVPVTGGNVTAAQCSAQVPAAAALRAPLAGPALQQQLQQGPEWHIVSALPTQHHQQLQSHHTAAQQHHNGVDVPPQQRADEEQQQMQQAAEAAVDPAEYQKNICRSLRAQHCSSIEQLAAIVSEHGQYMDAQAVAASFTAAARIGKQLQRQQQASQLAEVLEQQLLPLVQPRLRQFDALGLQMVLYSLASLQYTQEVLVLQLEVAVTPVAHHLPPGSLCQLLWSLGQLGFRPNSQLMKTLLRCSSRSMSFLQGQDLCQLLQGMLKLQVQPHALWLDACCARVLQLCAHQQLQPRALCSILHNLASLVCRQQQKHKEQQHEQDEQDEQGRAAGLPQPLLQKLLAATQQALEEAAAAGAGEQQGPDMLPQQQSSVCQCPQPGQHHLRLHNTGLAPASSHAARQPVVHMPTAAELLVPSAQQPQQQKPPQQLASRRALMRKQQQRPQPQEALTPAGLVTLADALRRLQTDPPGSWQEAYVAAAQQLMGNSSDARNLPLMLAPCVRWRRRPGRAWLQQYLVACHRQLPLMHPQGLAVLGHSLTALQVQPSAAWLTGYLAAADSRSLAATPAGCSFLLHTLGTWQQLGCLRQPAAGAGVAVGAAHAAGFGVEGTAAAAAGQQLHAAAQALARQCLRCFMEHGQSFTAEQLGMFCKGLAQWGMRGTPQLAGKLEQVVSQHLSSKPSSRRRRATVKQRLTARTLCSVLLALAVACPEAATPALLSLLWTAWSAWLLPTTTPAQAAAVASAVGRLGVQPSPEFAQGLLQQLVVAAEDAQLQHIAAVLLEAQHGGWQQTQQQVPRLLQAVLRKQEAELQSSEGVGALGPVLQSCSCGGGVSSSGSRLLYYGQANHRLKGWVTAAAACAAWRGALPAPQLQRAVEVYTSVLARMPNDEQGGAVEAHLQSLRAVATVEQ